MPSDRNSKKMILFHQGALGDWIVTFPVIKRLGAHFSRIDAICPASHGELAVNLGLINAVIPVESSAVTSLFTRQADPGLLKTILDHDAILLLSASVDLRTTIGETGHPRILSLAPTPPVHERRHVTAYLAAALHRKGWIKTPAINGDLWCQPGSRSSGTSLDQQKKPPAVLLHPGSGSQLKNGPFDLFLETAAMLEAQGHGVAFLLGPAEMGRPFMSESLAARNLPYVISRRLSDLLDRLKCAKAYIGNDSGPTHLAAYLGVPTVALFGASDARRWRPLGLTVKVLEPATVCPPCFETKSDHCSDRTCFDHVSATAVVAALEALLSQEAEGGRRPL
jgi:ADP-heptose:LPS heptosyltransferase